MIPVLQNNGEEKKIYFFDLNKEVIINSDQIMKGTYGIIASNSPKL